MREKLMNHSIVLQLLNCTSVRTDEEGRKEVDVSFRQSAMKKGKISSLFIPTEEDSLN